MNIEMQSRNRPLSSSFLFCQEHKSHQDDTNAETQPSVI